MKILPEVILPCLALGISTFVMLSTESILNISFNSSLLADHCRNRRPLHSHAASKDQDRIQNNITDSTIGLFLPILMMINAFAMLAGSGGAPRAAIAMGKNDKDGAQKIMGNFLKVPFYVTLYFIPNMLVERCYFYAENFDKQIRKYSTKKWAVTQTAQRVLLL